MTESATLLNAQLSFLVSLSLTNPKAGAHSIQDTHVALIHIPLEVYHLFLQPILHLILHNDCSDESGLPVEPHRPWQYWHCFVNVSITPNECSIACPRQQAEDLFRPVIQSLDSTMRKAISISHEDYSVIVISGEGLEAGQRVIDLTGPLALAGISIFFITSYYTDFILVPFGARSRVIHALEDRGFVFEAVANGEAGHMANPASPLLHSRHRNGSSTSSFDFPDMASTPPPTSVSELQTKTFRLLKRNDIQARVDPDIELVTCAGIKDSTMSSSSFNFSEGKLQLGIAKLLSLRPAPKFLSLTLTDSESASLTLEKHLTSHFYNQGEDLLLGKHGPEQVPITFDLRELPLESTGIVCGVASRLLDGMKGRIGHELFNMSYLSTARAGHVIVYQDELNDAMEALKGATENGFGAH